jgi:hypothetical protein
MLVTLLHHFAHPIRFRAMTSVPSQPSRRDSLQKQLDDAEKELRRRLEDACEAEAKGVATESTEQIRELENTLLAAASAAKQTIAVRSQMTRPRTVEERGDNDALGVREFTDDQGQPWRAWSVVPGQSRTSSTGGQFLGEFQDGWICFEGVKSSARRRLPYPRAKWPDIGDEELKGLLQQAIDAPIRVKKGAA